MERSIDMAINPKELLTKLRELWDGRILIEQHGPNSPQGTQWLADVRAYLELADPRLAAEFRRLSEYVALPLSSYTLGPLWTSMQATLRTTITKLEAQAPRAPAKVYGPGDALDLYQDLSQVISAAGTEIFIVDPYANEELFSLYLSKVRTGVKIRVLTGSPSSAMRSLAAKFAARQGINFEARHTNQVHDRVIMIDGRDCWVLGQSIKDAAMKKPTYLVPVDAVSDMAKLYEDVWAGALRF